MRPRITPWLALFAALAANAAQADRRRVQIPPEDSGIAALEARREAQLGTAREFRVFHEFSFADRLPESGITFRNQVTDDNKRDFKATHYDHSNGIAVADIDGDGRHDVYFLTQIGGNELWKNRGDGTFENVTERAGVALAERISVSAAFADADNDGDPDLFVTTVRMGNVLFENDGAGRFKDVSESAGVDHVGHSSGAMFFDYDNDGLLDLFVTNVGRYTTDNQGAGPYYVAYEDAFSGHLFPERTETSLLYRNLGDLRFREVSSEVGLVDGSWSGDATFTDLDGDRYPEIYVLNMQGNDHYWTNRATEGGRRFVDVTADYFPRTPWGAMGVKFFDFNNDGRQDLVITDMHSDMSRPVGPDEEKLKSVMTWTDEHLQGGADNIFGNALYENRGEEGFREVSDLRGVENYWPWGLTAADLNADGWEDLFLASSMSFPFRYGINSVLLNDRGAKFRDSEFILGVEPRRDGRTVIPFFDLDCDDPADADHFQCKGQEGAITLWGTVGTRSSAAFDIEGDGDLDILTNEFYDVPQVLVSDLAEKREKLSYLSVRLVGTKSNRDGLGALIKVTAGDRDYTKYHDGKSGYLSQSSLPLYFGLGEATAVDKVVVLWPSGVEQTVSAGIALNGVFEIVEDDGSGSNSP